MKNKWLIGLATGILSVSLCVGMFGCAPEGGEGKTDEEIAQAAIDLVGTLSKDIPSTTSDNFEVVGQVPVDKVYYDVVWTVTSDDVDGITDYVSIGAMNETTKFRPVTVTKYETAIDYTLTATVTVNKATKKADFVKHLPAAPRAGAGTKEDPFTVSEALELAAATESYSYYSVNGEYALVYVRGVITQAPTGENLTNKYGPKDFYIGDSADAEDTIQVYSVNWTETVPSGSVLCDGDTVLVQAYIQNYNGKYELTYWREGDQSPYTYHNGYIHELTPGPNHTDTPPTPPTPDSSFTPLETPVAGEYDFAMAVDGTWNYITGVMASTYYFGTTTNHSSAAKVTLEADGNNWVIKLGEKYIEISISGTHINAVYSTTKNGSWSWDTTEKVFVWTVGSEKYIIGNTGTYTNIGGIKLSDKATNHYAVLGNYTGTTTDPTAKGTKNNPYTVAEATNILHTLSDGEYYKVDGVVVPVYIKGIITVVGTTDNYGIKQFYIADTAGDTDNDVVIWSINWSTAVPSTTKLQVGDTIVVNAYLEYYQSTYEICSWKDGSTWHNGTVEEHIPAGGSVTPTPETDQEKANAALKEISLTTTEYTEVNTEGINLPTTNSYSATVTWSVTDTTYVEITSNVLKIKSLPTASTGVTLHVKVEVGSAHAEKDVTITVKPAADLSKYGTKDAPLTVTQALAIARAEATANNAFTSHVVYMTGVALATPVNAGNHYNQFEIGETKGTTDATKKILVYTINLEKGVPAIAQNDTIVICGYIKNYSNTLEFATNSTEYVYCVSNTRGTSTITKGELNGATIEDLATSGTNGTDITFHVTAPSGKKVSAVKVYGDAIDPADGAYTFKLMGDATVTVEVVDESVVLDSKVAVLSFGDTERAKDTQTNQYNETWEATRNGLTWTIANFSNNKGAWNSIKTGQKGTKANPDRPVTGTITTKSAIDKTVTKVIVDIASNANIPGKVNAFKLLVSSDSTFSNATEVTLTMAAGENTFEIPTANQGTNLYYRIVIDCLTGSDNGFVQVNSVTYMGH